MVAILADIHSNFEALKAVSKNFKGVKEIWCLGDIVGYGPNPNECCQWVKKRAKYCLLGNHDAAVLGKVDLFWFNPFAAQAVIINQKILTEENKEFLKNLKKKQKISEMLLVHGAPQDPIFEYIFTADEAGAAFQGFQEKICFVGHTHCPVIFEKRNDGISEVPIYLNEEFILKKNCRYIINPGAVGQPRDRDSRASYLLFDRKNLTVELRRVAYPIEKTQKKMEALGLPEFLIHRLSFGR